MSLSPQTSPKAGGGRPGDEGSSGALGFLGSRERDVGQGGRGRGPFPSPSIRTAFLHVTRACNLACRYCYFSARIPSPREMTAAEWADHWPDLVALRPQKVVFTGGEPLLREDLMDLLDGLASADPAHSVLRCVNTNGVRVSPALARALVGRADEVRISLDALEDRNDALRGPGAFRAAVEALECFRDAGFLPKVLVTATRLSLPDLPGLLYFLAARGITRVNVNALRPLGRGRDDPGLRPIEGEVGRAVLAFRDRAVAAGMQAPAAGDGATSPGEGAECSCGVGRTLNVLPDGDVYPCHVLSERPLRLGNLREASLRDLCAEGGILSRLRALDFREVADALPHLASPARAGACLGDWGTTDRGRPAWRSLLPLLDESPPSEEGA